MKKIFTVIAALMIVTFAFSGCAKKQQANKPSDNPMSDTQKTPEKEEKETELTLYFANSNAQLEKVTEKKAIGDTPVEKAVVEALIDGPDDESFIPVIPQETKVNSVKTEDSVCTVDLSEEFVSKRTGGTSTDMLAVYSIVNSLTELDGTDSVQFLIDGEKLEIFGGLIFDEPFTADESLIK